MMENERMNQRIRRLHARKSQVKRVSSRFNNKQKRKTRPGITTKNSKTQQSLYADMVT